MLQNQQYFLKFEFLPTSYQLLLRFWADKPEFNKLICAYDIYHRINTQIIKISLVILCQILTFMLWKQFF
jgi:hypothetical protein